MCRPYSSQAAFLFTLLSAILVLTSASHADIFEWQWVDPLDHSQGKKESNILCPGGAGLVPEPGMVGNWADLTKAYLIGFVLSDTYFFRSTLTDADFTGSDLTGAYFGRASLNGTSFAGTTITGAGFLGATDLGFTQSQFESTQSYSTGNLIGIDLQDNDLSGWNFASKNLSGAVFGAATLADANFSGANLTGASFKSNSYGYTRLTNANFSGAVITGTSFRYTVHCGFTQEQFKSTYSYSIGDLTGVDLSDNDLTGFDFSGADLTDARFEYAHLAGVPFGGATIAGAEFSSTTYGGFTQAQFESTYSFNSGNLTGVILERNELPNWDFGGKNLTGASFAYAKLTNANFAGATIAGADFVSTVDRGFTQDQFRSTDSYDSGDLTGVHLGDNELIGWNFAAKDLSQADFDYATLRDADFSTSNLSQSSFRYVNIDGGSFSGAELVKTSFYNAVLTGTDFMDANLAESSLTKATLTGVNLSGANLSDCVFLECTFSDVFIAGANLTSTTNSYFSKTMFESTASYASGNLAGINLSDNDLTGWVFTGKELTGASFEGATLSGADFYRAHLGETSFVASTLTGVNFEGALLADAVLENADLTGASLENATLSGASLHNSVVTDVDLTDAKIDGANLAGAVSLGFTRTQFQSTYSFTTSGNLARINLSDNDLTGWVFTGRDLTDAYFSGATLRGASFYLATLEGTNFSHAVIDGADFDSTTDLGFTRAQLEMTDSHVTGNLAGIGLNRNDMTGWSFAGKNLAGAFFWAATVRDADFSGANLAGASFLTATAEDADFTGADLSGTSFYLAELGGANFTGAVITGADFDSTIDLGFTQSQFESTASYVDGDLANIYLNRNNLIGWNFDGKDLSGAFLWDSILAGASFRDAILGGTDFTNAVITGADFHSTTDSGFTWAQLESTYNYTVGGLVDLDLSDNALDGWNFESKNLGGTSLADSTLTGANFLDATLTGCDFSGATVNGADFTSTTDSGFTKAQLESTASFLNDDLTGVVLAYNDLAGWDFAGKTLADVSFYNSILTGTDFAGAVITGARFYSTTDGGFTKDQFESTASYASGDLHAVDLGGNDLTEWDFAGKDLTGSDLGDSILTDADFSGAVIAGCSFVSLTDDGLSQTQFESTASYATGRLNGINLGLKDLTGWNFAGKNITDSGWFLATLDGADLSGADARGALDMIYATAGDTTNFVQPDGTVSGLHVAAGEQVRVLDYDGMAGIYVMEGFSIDPEGMLLVGLEDADWGSTIAFESGISVVFDGTLKVELCDEFLPTPGDQWQLFDFTGVTPGGDFDDYLLPTVAGAVWDTSTLLSDGVLRLVSSLPGDLNGDGFVGSADLDIVRGFWGQTVTTGSLLEGDPSGDGLVGSADLDIVRANWGHGTPATGASVPEPATLSGLLILGLTVVWGLTRRR